MADNDQPQDAAARLRERAESLWRQQSAETRPQSQAGGDVALEEALHLLHELEVHQIELEMQNEELRRAQDELTTSRARYFELYDLAPVGYLTLSTDGVILEANLTAALLLGLDRGQLAHRPLTRFILPDDQDVFYLHRKRLLASGQAQVCELRMVRGGQSPKARRRVARSAGVEGSPSPGTNVAEKSAPAQADAGPLWVRMQATVRHDNADAPVWRATLSDITEQKRAQNALADSEARLRALLTNAPIMLFAVDGAGIVTFADGQGLPGLGLAAGTAAGRLAQDFFAGHPMIVAALQRALAGQAEAVVERIAGMWWDLRLLPWPEPDRRPAGVIGVALDVTAAKEAEAALQLANDDLELRVQERTAELSAANEASGQGRDQLHSLTRRLVEAQENERRAIARELHDSAGQALAAMLLDLGALARDLAGRPEIIARVQRLLAAADGLMSELHTLAANLHPVTLTRLGLVPAIRQHIGNLQNPAGPHIDLEEMGFDDCRLPPEVEAGVYRVTQEALSNAIRHAQAHNIDVFLQRQEHRLLVTIEDNGIGFSTETPADGRLGLLSMRERIEMLGGSLAIESTPGTGTTVFVAVPL